MLTREQIKEALARTDEKYKTPEANRQRCYSRDCAF